MRSRDKLTRTEVISDISERDDMIRLPPQGGGRAEYFKLGRKAIEVVRRAMRMCEADEPSTILDLPSGHGRVMRMLKAAFPEAKLTACDIDTDAVDFCADTFGAEPAYATLHPRDMTFAQPFDLIWSGSLLTHLEEERFVAFLELFNSNLAPGGLLAFTTNGQHAYRMMRHILPEDDPSWTEASPEALQIAEGYFPIPRETAPDVVRAYEEEGFGYVEYWFMENFGATLSSPAWVCKQLERLPDLRLVIYLEQGWGEAQDFVVCQRRAEASP
jgi:methyltransferase family protein